MDLIMYKKCPSLPHLIVSNFGRVFGFRKNGASFEFSYMKDKDGYLKIGTSKNGKSLRVSVHRLVAETFIGASSLAVNHKDFNRGNNKVENLEYVSNKQNTHHSLGAGRIFQGNQVFDDCSVLAIYTLAPHKPLKEFQECFNSSASAVSHVITGRHFKWFHREYFNEVTFSEKRKLLRAKRDAEILASKEPGVALAKKLGVTKTRVYQIRNSENVSKWI